MTKKYISGCCGANLIENSDRCSACKENSGKELDDTDRSDEYRENEERAFADRMESAFQSQLDNHWNA